MFSFWGLTSCGGVMLLHQNWGKFKSFVTSWKEPEPAAQAHAELSGLPPPTNLALLGCYQWLSHPWSQASAFMGNWASAHLDPGPRQPVVPLAFMRGGFGPLGSLGPGPGTGVVKCCRPQEGL